jgi:LacI family transcriptional regulator
MHKPSTVTRRRVTMSDVANLAQCSQSTVSVVLSPDSKIKISKDTRERILKAAASLGYAIERAPAPRVGPLRRIAVVFDDLTVCPEAVIAVDGVREFTWETGDIVSAYNCHADPQMEERTLAAILRGNPSAIVYTTVRTRAVTVPEQLYKTEVPVVLLNCYSKDRAFPSVVPGDVAGGNRATDLLIAAGHRRIAHITGEAWMDVSKDRNRGYREALATADIPFDPELVREGNFQLGSGYEATLSLMRMARPPTAIFCSNDRMAIGCYDALKQLRLSIPNDVSVVGFDDDEIASQLIPKLTTLKFPRHQMGIWAAERALAPGHSREETYRIVKIECELVERQSVARFASAKSSRENHTSSAEDNLVGN